MRLTSMQKSGFAVGAVGKDIAYAFVAGFILYYFNDVLGISSVFVGTMMMVARIFDAFNDPFMGVIVEKTKTPIGKFRPWLLTGTIINAFIIYAMFAVPESITGSSLLVYITVLYFLWGMSYTLMDIPFWSMIPALTSPGKERENLTVIGRTFASIGFAVPTIATVALVAFFGDGNERAGFKMVGLIVAIVFVIAQVVCVLTIKEQNKTTETKPSSIGKMFKALFANDQALAVVVGITLFNASIYLTAQLALYFFEYDIGNKDLFGLFSIVGGVAQIVGMVIFPLLRKKLSSKSVMMLAGFATVIGYIGLFILGTFGIKEMAFLSVPAFIAYFGFGLLTVLTTIFLANSVDYGEKKTGERNESVIFSMQTFVVKLASAFAIFIAGVSLELIGLDNKLPIQSSGTLLGLRVVMFLVPMVGIIISILYLRKKYTIADNDSKS